MFTQQIKKGDNYTDLKKCITINILDYDFQLAQKVHSVYHMIEDEDITRLSEAIEIHFLDLEKLRKGMSIENLEPSLQRWLKFLASKRREEFEMLAKKDKDIKTAYERLQELSADDKQRMVYEAREAFLMDQRTMKEVAHQEGEASGYTQGLEQGLEQGKAEAVISAFKSGLPIDMIEKFSGMSEEDIKRLVKENDA